MPLRVRAKGAALWIAGTVRPAGAPHGVRIRRRAGSDDPRLAREEAAAIEAQILRAAWHGERRPERSFAEAVIAYLRHEPRSPGTVAMIRRLLLHFGETPLRAIRQEQADQARAAILRPGATPGTVRRNLFVPLRAVLTHAAGLDWCDPPRFRLPAEPRGRVAFLLPDPALRLTEDWPLARFLLLTGCRLGETLTLRWPDVDLTGARAMLWEGETKGGGRRVVRLVPAAVALLARLPRRDGHVFLNRRGAPYRASGAGGGGQIRKRWATACRRAGLAGITPHALRHTWASWHYAVYRDLLRLKAEGGWKSGQAERYAHLLPEGHVDAIRHIWGTWQASGNAAAPGG